MQFVGRFKIVSTTLLFLLVTSAARAADDSYYDLAIDHIALTEGKLPLPATNPSFESSPLDKFGDYVVLDGPGDAFTTEELHGVQTSSPHIFIHAPDKKDVAGRLFIKKDDNSGMVQVKFKIPATDAKADAKNAFYTAMENHYEGLLSDGAPGAAWFRLRAREARKALGDKRDDNAPPIRRPESLDDTYSLFSGNQALSENLQLDKVLPPGAAAQGEKEVDVSSLEGIKVSAMDWKSRIQGKTPKLDPLAAVIPADQHAIFFHTFQSMIDIADEADRDGSLFLQLGETQSQDAGTRTRYEKQLGLSLTGLGRMLGPQLVNSVAITGSDPYLRSGSDLAMILDPKQADALKTLLSTQITAAGKMYPDAKDDSGKVGSLSYTGLRTPDRTLSSYMAVLSSGAVVITNSPAQLARIAAVQDGQADPLSKAPEYIFFRDRYKLDEGDESALLVLSDATIRRWCGARWRIGDSRRTRAAAVLADLNAKNLDDLVANKVEAGAIYGEFPVPGLDKLRLTSRGTTSDSYGSLDFLTPISEMNVDQVTVGEAEAYKRWRDSYETNWRGVFDPIAVRLHVSPKKLAADLTVIPLIFSSDYRPFIDVASGAKIDPASGDPHECLFRAGLSINTKSPIFQQWSNTVSQFAPGVKIEPFSWIGQSVWIYADNDPFWAEMAAADKPDEFFESHYSRLPVALRFEVANGFKLTAFLVAVHGFVDQSGPGMTIWENLKYKDQAYVKISPSEKAKTPEMKDLAIYYVATGDSFLLTLNEDLLKCAIDRQVDRDVAVKAGKPVPSADPPLLGENLAVQEDFKWLTTFDRLMHKEYQAMMQERSWSNLTILNEWKHRYPDQDPVKIYERFFHAKLIDPAAGEYAWNDKLQTMESSTYGSPTQPKDGPADITLLKGLLRANLGLTFENDGLRASTQVDREGK